MEFNMKVLFKNRTKYTKQVYDTFLQFHNQKYGSSYIFYTALVTILIFFCLGMNLKYKNFFTASIFLVIMIAFLLYRFIHPKKEIKKELKTDKIQKGKEFQFRFFEKNIEIVDKLELSKVKYFNIKHIYETDNYFYLYIDRNHAFLLDKTKFVIGNCEDFKIFIKHKCPFRFKSYCNKKSL